MQAKLMFYEALYEASLKIFKHETDVKEKEKQIEIPKWLSLRVYILETKESSQEITLFKNMT
ncbi:CLUMA_CG012928, isoform A [Clunio marinus]|uniref:CLUMA_CG012928, isoform A n=1 Tax=Clunio marinus TaxID=568069 RepID=A0A1J1IHD7_9DIPT|nr:CLUMA_CG012928, isoform A [Clunio marinus]